MVYWHSFSNGRLLVNFLRIVFIQRILVGVRKRPVLRSGWNRFYRTVPMFLIKGRMACSICIPASWDREQAMQAEMEERPSRKNRVRHTYRPRLNDHIFVHRTRA